MELKPGYKQTEVGVIPEEWEVYNLKDLSLKITDGDHLTPKREATGYYLLSARNVLNGSIDTSDVDYVGFAEYQRMKQRCGPEAGDILLSCSGTIGRVTVVPPGFECVLVRSAALVKPDHTLVDAVFLQFWLQSGRAQAQISSSVNQGAQPNLFLNHIERLQCPIPPLPAQRAIAEILSDIDAKIRLLECLITKKKRLKQAAMQELLTGKRRLPGFKGEWVVKRLCDVAHIKTGSRNNEDKIEDGEYPFFVRSDNVERINSYAYDCEAILVPGEGRIGEIFHYVNGRFDVHQRVYAITQFKPGFSGKFIHSYMAMNFGPWAMQNTVKATVDSLRLPTFQSFEMRVPPTKEEQNTIAAALSDIDAELTTLETLCGKTRALKQATMQELLTGRIRIA